MIPLIMKNFADGGIRTTSDRFANYATTTKSLSSRCSRRHRSSRSGRNVDERPHPGALPNHPEPASAQELAQTDPRRARTDDGALVSDDGRLAGPRFDVRKRLQRDAVRRRRRRRPLARVVDLQLLGHRHLPTGQLRNVPTVGRSRFRQQRLAHRSSNQGAVTT